MYVIGDIHGHLETLKNLVDRLDDDYILVGDLVDRGPNSAGVIEFVIHNEVKMVIGNHERMMIDAFNEILENNILVEFVDEINSTKEDMFYFNNMFMRKNPDTEFWLNNGGRNTLLSYITEDCFDLDKFMTHIEYLQKIPYYYIFDNLKDDNGKKLVVSHSHITNNFSTLIDIDNKKINELTPKDIENQDNLRQSIIWNRDFSKKTEDEYFNIFGHTMSIYFRYRFGLDLDENHIHRDMEKGFIGIDTGIYINHYKEAGKLTAIKFPSLNVIQQVRID
jgi:serine/threonine protein phosphatase 1